MSFNYIRLWILISIWIHFCYVGVFGQNLVGTKYTQSSEFLIYKAYSTFDEAKSYCEGLSAKLAKLESQKSKDAVYDEIRFRGGEKFWIGATDLQQEGSWKWLDDTDLNNTNWGRNEPDNDGWALREENCLSLLSTGIWHDKYCPGRQNFVCEKEGDYKNRAPEFKLKKSTFIFHVLHEDKKSFYDALASCAKDDSRLVEISSSDVNDYLKKKMQPYGETQHFWTGGSDLQETNTWRWNNRSLVSMNWGWKDGQPNGESEHCILSNSGGWYDISCARKLAYICEQLQVSSVNVYPIKAVVGTDAGNYISCNVYGIYPSPTISWYIENNEIPTHSTNAVYQVKGSHVAELRTEHATILEQGNYTCQATNQIGDTTYSARGSATIKVPSTPQIVSSIPNSCNSSLVISWIRHFHANGIKHRIRISNLSESFSFWRTPQSSLDVYATKNLSSSSTYTIEITPCPGEECIERYTTVKISKTGGIPRKVKNVTVQTGSNRSCVVTWNYTSLTLRQFISGYKIIISESLAELSFGSSKSKIPTKIISTGTTDMEYVFHGKPNRRYSFGIQATTCAGAGDISESKGDCVTEKQAPYETPSPKINSAVNGEGKAEISIAVPDQTNGPISCLFVMVRSEENGENPVNSIDELLETNSSNSSNSDEYIAVSQAVPRTDKQMSEITLGDDKNTSCDIYSTNSRKRRSLNDVIVGNNRKLNPEKNYSIYTLSTTPSNGRVFVGASKLQRLVSNPEEQENTEGQTNSGKINAITIIVPVLVVLVVLVSIAITVLVCRRKRNEGGRKVERGNLTQDTHDPTQENVVYRNTVFQENNKDRSTTDISMTELEGAYKGMIMNNAKQFIDQYQNLHQDTAKSTGITTFASIPDLKKKNRYKNILPFDHTRVVIKNIDTGYINACYVDGFEREKKFIATQGPLSATLSDFWLMVVEQRCSVIVMLAKCYEAGKNKCAKYWPDQGGVEQYGPVSVTNIQEVRFCGFIRRTMEIYAVLEGMEINTRISQFHLLTWPDHGVPITTSVLIRMHKEAMETDRSAGEDVPMIVHCSAGAGRTGTFVGYDILLNQSKETTRADIYQCVLKMRQQRVQMVQNCDQYILIHKLLLESNIFGDTDLLAADAVEEFNRDDYKMRVAVKQYENLSRLEPVKISFGTTANKSSPRDNTKIIIDKLEEDTHTPSIDASYVECYDESSRMIASRGPVKNNVQYFLRAILHEGVSVVVCLDSKQNAASAEYYPYKVGEIATYGTLTVTLQDVERFGDFEKKRIAIRGFDKSVSVTHLQLLKDMENCDHKDAKNITELVDQMQKTLRESKSQVALVHCRDGVGNTGAFCAIVNLIERIKVENHVNAFRAVKDLRDCRPGMVKTLDQYMLCHLAVVDYLKSFDIYSNFK